MREDNVGSSTQNICYPGISSCIAITGASGGGMIGCHITVATPLSEIDQIFQLMKTGGGQGCPEFYVIGALTKFKGNTKVSEMNSRKKISNKVKAMINPNAVVKFVDIATLGCGDAHILVEKSGGAAKFYFCDSGGNIVTGGTYPSIKEKREIANGRFEIR